MSRLVVTADDAGLLPGMTAGTLEAAERGIVTAVSVTAVGEDVPGAVAALAARPEIDVAAHLVLVGETPLSPPAEIPSLVDGAGRFLRGAGAFARRCLAGDVAIAEVERELRRQLARLLDAGLVVRQLNSHQHVHALPALLEVIGGLAAEHGIPFVRLPEDPLLPRRPSPRAVALWALGALARRGRPRLPQPVTALTGTVGLHGAGHLDAEALAALLRRLRGRRGSYELVCHPGRGDAALAARYDWGYAWDAEREALCDPGLPVLVAGAGVQLASFRRLAAAG